MLKITAQECKKSTSGWRTSLKNVVVSCENNAENGIYSPPMKVISNTILFVYSLGVPSPKLRAGVTRNSAIISMEPLHYLKTSEDI